MKKLIFTVIATLMLSLAVQAQVPDTLDVGDYIVVTTPTSDTTDTYTVFKESEVIAGYYVPVVELFTKEDLITFTYEQADILSSGYGVKEVEAREMNRQANMMKRILNGVDTVPYFQRGLEKYVSQLSGRYVIVYKGERSILDFDDQLVHTIAGSPNIRMRVSSNNNVDLVNLEAEPVDFYAKEFGNFFGVDDEGRNIRLRKLPTNQ